MVAELHVDRPTRAREAEWCTQAGFAYRFDWGPNGLRTLAPTAEVVVIVDVLRFTSAVSAAVEGGSTVFPYRWADDGALAHAAERDAVLAGGREHDETSLSPTDLLAVTTPLRVVLPSPNGSALSFAARDHGATHVLAGCLRNATATARLARKLAGPGGAIAVIAAGERWRGTTGPIRPAVEDLLGAGAILAALDPAAALSAPCCSPEAAAARAAFVSARPRLYEAIAGCGSGRELISQGRADDVATCAALDVTDHGARLLDGAYVRA